MVTVRSVGKPVAVDPVGVDAAEAGVPPARVTKAGIGAPTVEESRSVRDLVVRGCPSDEMPPYEGPPLTSVIGPDERVRVLDTDLPPWRMICALKVTAGRSGAVGTGWFVGPRTVITAGHCLYSTRFFGGWADSVEVIPGLNGATGEHSRPFGSVTSTRIASTDRWTAAEDPDFDIGVIHLDEPVGEETGWFAVGALPADELTGFLVNIAGYPSDLGHADEQFHARNRVLHVTDRRIFYEVDTFGGQSGAPVWVHRADDDPPLVVGVHAYGIAGTPADLALTANSAPRIIPEMFDVIAGWIAEDTPSP